MSCFCGASHLCRACADSAHINSARQERSSVDVVAPSSFSEASIEDVMEFTREQMAHSIQMTSDHFAASGGHDWTVLEPIVRYLQLLFCKASLDQQSPVYSRAMVRKVMAMFARHCTELFRGEFHPCPKCGQVFGSPENLEMLHSSCNASREQDVSFYY